MNKEPIFMSLDEFMDYVNKRKKKRKRKPKIDKAP